ncbi:DUF2310 family Zn-ribbon-containing protein [Aeoliella sp.]|uniref:DUF2310 family Zn-ribbon-containing protein n=1 Tax=Aeoliella sp. TaxID=2795800 RepID=UPI003CCC0225
MFLSQVSFGNAPANLDLEQLEDNLTSYFESLRRNGQVCGDEVFGVSGGKVVAYAYLARPDSHLLKYFSPYTLEYQENLHSLLGDFPQWTVMEDDQPSTECTLPNDQPLCLFTSATSRESPVRILQSGQSVPLYCISIDPDERERLVFWAREYARLDGIWLACGELEIAAYEQLATPTSLLAQNARDFCATIEAAMNVPVYYFLMRHYGRGVDEVNRCCPACGGSWNSPDFDPNSADFWNLPFRCDKCRLVSPYACSDEDTHAHIGEYTN